MKNIPPKRVIAGLLPGVTARADPEIRAGLFERVMDQQSGRLFPWVPVGFALGCALYLAAPDEPNLLVLVAACGLFGVWTFAARSRYGLFVTLTALLTIICGMTAGALNPFGPVPPKLLDKRVGPVTIEATVISLDRAADGRERAMLAVKSSGLDLPRNARLSWRPKEHQTVRPGDTITGRAILMPPPDAAVPDGYNFRRDAYFSGFGAVGFMLGAPQSISPAQTVTLSGYVERARDWLAKRIQKRAGEDSGPVAAALVTGKRRAISEETKENLRIAGLGHLLAISGLHMALVAGAVFGSVRFLLVLIPGVAMRWNIKKPAAIIALLAATAFLAISGGSVSTQRAFVMTSIMLLAILLDRPAISMRNLALAALVVLLLEPSAIAGAGFQMSFAATIGLIAVYESPAASRFFRMGDGAGSLVSRAFWLVAAFLAITTLTTLIAGSATTPFGAYHFNRMTPYALLANLAAMPIVSIVVMPAAVLAMVLMPFGFDSLGWTLMGLGIDYIEAVAAFVAGLEGADWSVPSFPFWCLIVMIAGGLWLCLWQGRARLAGIAVIVAGIAGSALVSDPPDVLVDRDGGMIGIAQGDALHILGTRNTGYVRDVWRRHVGAKADQVTFTRCRETVCVLREGQTSVAIVDEKKARYWRNLCGRVDVILLRGWLDNRLSRNPACIPSVIDRTMLKETGALALRFDDMGTRNPPFRSFSRQAARPASTDRPWGFGQ